ncbi:glyoxalase [Streptomyces tateyamensis]|uniref:Glyoxalase n=1 Tax=Streptomyces tateyamensis TaxID=565073 RepID=A0A2V4NPB0_9ACTN|nr:VOC family protein [Streptomyces tateyamensis]PYC87390.1 glyoxalase [Streptomyces tateyamensis]
MPRMTEYREGMPCWVDLNAADPDRACAFYHDLFGWEFADPDRPGGHYRPATLRGQLVAAVNAVPAGTPTAWVSYLAADDADQVAARITDAGGQLLTEPFDAMTAGRIALARDPAGAVFGLWQGREQSGSGLANESGSFTWNENLSNDPRTARIFYSQVFGYEYDEVPGLNYTVAKVHGAPVGGIGELPPMVPPGSDSFWSTYFAVTDTDMAAARIVELGGELLVPPTDSPYGRMAVARDDGGAFFCIISPTRG